MKGIGRLRAAAKCLQTEVAFAISEASVLCGQPRSLKSPMPFMWRRRSVAWEQTLAGRA